MSYELLKWLHVLSATLLVGGGFGSAFHLVLASIRRKPSEAEAAARGILRFDALFGFPAAVFQAVGGIWLAHQLKLPLSTPWVATSLFVYGVVMATWVVVVALEFAMRRWARVAAHQGQGLPRRYWAALAAWMLLGGSGFTLFAAIFWMMLTKRPLFG